MIVVAANALSSVSCGQTVAFDLSLGKAKGVANTKTFAKSLWTCCMESVTEYCRIVFDLFPDRYQVMLGSFPDHYQVLHARRRYVYYSLEAMPLSSL